MLSWDKVQILLHHRWYCIGNHVVGEHGVQNNTVRFTVPVAVVYEFKL